MALTNAEKQARWRERHIVKRRDAQRIVNLLVRKHLTDEHIAQLAGLLNSFLNRWGARTLRRRLRELTESDSALQIAKRKESAQVVRAAWLQAHPDKTAKDFRKLSGAKVWAFLKSQGAAATEAERQAYERDHPGQLYPEHECGLTDREYTDLERWRRAARSSATRRRHHDRAKDHR